MKTTLERIAELGLTQDLIKTGLAALEDEKKVVVHNGRVSLSETFQDELACARELRRLRAATKHGACNPDAPGLWSMTPHADQLCALQLAAAYSVLVLSGGPGCIDADTPILIETEARAGAGGRTYTVEDAYHYRKGIARKGRRIDVSWQGVLRTLSMKEAGSVGYNEIRDIVFSGVKEGFLVKSHGGRSIVVSADHPFRVPDETPGADQGYLPLAQLKVGDSVIVRRAEKTAKARVGKNKAHRAETHVPFHPHAHTKHVNAAISRSDRTQRKTYTYQLMRDYRLIIEAEMNGLPLATFVARLQQEGTARGLQFLPPDVEVHHRNEDPQDNRRENLVVMTKAEHAREHGSENKQHFGQQQTELDTIESITPVGPRRVYDLVMADPWRNFVACDFVLHNCGKTTTCRAIVAMYEAAGLTPMLVCPTGKAAIRLAQQTGRPAATIHRALGRDPSTGDWLYTRSNPLPCSALIIDESSMLSPDLLAALLRACAAGTRVLFVGDVDQLPSITAGRVLHDIIESSYVPIIRLTQIFRQASESAIPYAARDLNAGRVWPGFYAGPGADVRFIEADDEMSVGDVILRAVGLGITHYRGIATQDVQVLSPQRAKTLGVDSLNIALQSTLNPPAHADVPTVQLDNRIVARPNDRVLHTENNYDQGVMNGEIGWIVAANATGIRIEEMAGALQVDPLDIRASDGSARFVAVVRYETGLVAYTSREARQLQLAYAVTGHKYQGSSAPAVVIPLHDSLAFMLTRPWLYTAMTRAERYVLLVGQRRMLERAAGNTRGTDRRTWLREMLDQVRAASAP